MNITGLVQEVAQAPVEVKSPRAQAREADTDEICIVRQYADGSVGVMRCLASGQNVPTDVWRAIQGQVGYVERDSEDEGGASRIVFDGGCCA